MIHNLAHNHRTSSGGPITQVHMAKKKIVEDAERCIINTTNIFHFVDVCLLLGEIVCVSSL